MSNSFSDLSPEQKRAEIQAVIDGKTTAAGIALKWMMQDALGLLGHPKADDIADVARGYGGYADNENGLRGTWTLMQQFTGWLAAEQASHALTRDTYERGAQANAAKIEQLRAGLAELCAAWDAYKKQPPESDPWEQVCANSMGLMELDALVARLAPEAARPLTRMQHMVERQTEVEELGWTLETGDELDEPEADEPITAAALEREGWTKSGGPLFYPFKEIGEMYSEYRVTMLFVESKIAIQNIHGSFYVTNCHTMRDLRQLVALFTPKDTTN